MHLRISNSKQILYFRIILESNLPPKTLKKQVSKYSVLCVTHELTCLNLVRIDAHIYTLSAQQNNLCQL
jgi:hypothetical protein